MIRRKLKVELEEDMKGELDKAKSTDNDELLGHFGDIIEEEEFDSDAVGDDFESQGKESGIIAQLKSKIKYVVHSHYDSDCNPSQHDIDNCNSVGIPYLIVSYPDKKHYILEPK